MKVFQYFISIGALVGAVVAIVQVYEFYKEFKGDISDLQSSLEELEGVKGEVGKLQDSLEQMKMASQQVSDLEARLGVIQSQIPQIAEEIAANSENAIARTNKDVSVLKSEVQDLSQKIDSGVSILEHECKPLGKPIRMEAHTSAQFCDSELAVAVGEIRLSDNVVETSRTRIVVPKRTSIDGCQVHFLAIGRDAPSAPTVDLIARCRK